MSERKREDCVVVMNNNILVSSMFDTGNIELQSIKYEEKETRVEVRVTQILIGLNIRKHTQHTHTQIVIRNLH
jgi:hypothetical protein